MALSVNWSTFVITVPQADLTPLGGNRYELDVDAFRLELKDIEDSETGMAFPKTHNHNTTVTLSGVTYARVVEILSPYTVEFENGNYTVVCVGANHNISDVKVVNSVSLVIGNSAGLIQVTSGSGLSVEQAERLEHIWRLLGLDASNPVTTTTAAIAATDIAINITGNGETSTTLTRV